MLKEMNIADSVDRISTLPDEVLRRILSFLPTKIGLSTCILSIRWRYLFPFSNNLDFNDSLVFNRRRYKRSPNGQTLHFIDFVDRCIMLMNELLLKCHHGSGATSHVNSWIRAARRLRVRELDLRICGREFRTKHLCVFTISTLVVLKLSSLACSCNIYLNVPSFVELPCLKTLHLDSIEFLDDISTERLFSSCPVLEEVFIEYCNMANVGLTLSSPSLKRLTIWENKAEPIKLVLDAPCLLFLECEISAGVGYMLKNLHSLSEAYVYIDKPCLQFHGTLYPAVLDFFEGIRRVESLSLSGEYGDYFGRELDALPLLENLTRLELSAKSSLNLSAVIKFLHCTPNLEEFVFLGCLAGLHEDGCVDVPFCVSSRLKVIDYRVYCYDDGPNLQKDAMSLEYFLKNANVLERMAMWSEDIDLNGKVAQKWRMMKETIEKLGQSKTCQINFLIIG